MLPFFITLLIGFLLYLLKLSKKEIVRKDKIIKETIICNDTDNVSIDDYDYDKEDLSGFFYKLLEDDRQQLMRFDNWKELDAVIRYYEDNEVYLPNELIIKLIRFDDRQTMIEFMEVQRKAYARMLTSPVYKPKRKTLPKK